MLFKHDRYDFGGDHNTTFYVYLYNFRAPFLLQVCLQTIVSAGRLKPTTDYHFVAGVFVQLRQQVARLL